MKTRIMNSVLLAAIKITFLVLLFTIVSCNNKKHSSQAHDSSTNAIPPKVDIHTAVVTGDLQALEQHIHAGTDLNEKDPFGGSSPLITAAVFGKTKEAKMLIDAGADLNFQNKDGSTALHSAAFFCRLDILKMLLDKGADKTIRNKFGATAYESVNTPFDQVKNTYDIMGKTLGPLGLKLDYAYLQKTRPEIAAMLK